MYRHIKNCYDHFVYFRRRRGRERERERERERKKNLVLTARFLLFLRVNTRRHPDEIALEEIWGSRRDAIGTDGTEASTNQIFSSLPTPLPPRCRNRWLFSFEREREKNEKTRRRRGGEEEEEEEDERSAIVEDDWRQTTTSTRQTQETRNTRTDAVVVE